MLTSLIAALIWAAFLVAIIIHFRAVPRPFCVCGHPHWQHDDYGTQRCRHARKHDDVWHHCTCRTYNALGRTWGAREDV